MRKENMIRVHFLFLFIVLFFCEPLVSQSWSLAKEKNGVKVFTRKIAGWGIKEYKVIFQVKSSLKNVIKTLKDVPGRYQWIHNTMEVREIARPNSDVVCIYNRINAPWPVSDRDNITKFSFSYPSPKTVRIEMKVIITHAKAPVYDGIVRIERLEGHWFITDQGNGYIEIMQQCVAEPGGNIPDWLANSAAVDSPYNSMYNLKRYIEK